MMEPRAAMKWQRQGSSVIDEDLVEAAFGVLNRRDPPHSREPIPDVFALDGELVIDTPGFQTTVDREGIGRLTSTLPEAALFGYCEAFRNGGTIVGRFTAGGFGPNPAFGRYALQRRGNRVKRLELEIEPDLDRELSAGMAWPSSAWEAHGATDNSMRRGRWAAAPDESEWWRRTTRDSTTPVPIMLWAHSLFKRALP